MLKTTQVIFYPFLSNLTVPGSPRAYLDFNNRRQNGRFFLTLRYSNPHLALLNSGFRALI